ncbi:CCA tRNA nucleotidyltransferase [Tautonia plasticadhaerens]|uniref:tRNA nucleotidyltransferase/poly(A) polymerase n=1 Tax=Tautonia plasticadhaerens TaxID=2527974 RepID=A0A518GXE2_9BACT|nr:CCA tRNA nucleotidyltransferase [Tautonia plasticadhaerens]QDV33266.1 tRNA nucleotidyltransferase/poly(A) polymerase [Tautonia plasticadhaerens]
MGENDLVPSATDDPRRSFALDVVRRLQESGHRALWAGGCVRDLLIGLEPSDYDVATDAPPERVMQLFRRTVPVGINFGVVRVLGPRPAGEVEVATFRSDGAYLDGRRPETVAYSSPEEDASRRDFTINGMFLDPIRGDVIDFVGGRLDLQAGLLRAIGDPAARFAEDKLRLVRAVRFASRFGLRIEAETSRALGAMAPQVTVVAAERIAQELRKMLAHPSRAAAMRVLMEAGLVAEILPELVPLVGRPAGLVSRPGDDLWDHTLGVLDALPHDLSFPLGLAALLHESGTAAGGPGEPDAVDRVADRLKLANAERERASWLVRRHRDLREPGSLPTARLKRLLAEPGIGDLLTLHRADAVAAGDPADHVDDCERYLRDEPDGPIRPDPLLTGKELKQIGLPPGPAFKAWLDRAYDAQLEGKIADRDQAIAWVLRQSAPGIPPQA